VVAQWFTTFASCGSFITKERTEVPQLKKYKWWN